MTHGTVGTVYLRVADIARQVRFYEDVIGLRELRTADDTVYLGVDDAAPLLALLDRPNFVRPHKTTGLFHFAILLPTRLHLAQALQHFAQTRTPLQGMSDHIVSEAIYLADPEGNGIEIYRDRPREAWYKDGEFQLTTIPMDVNGVLGELQHAEAPRDGLPAGTIMGHVHLHVGDVAAAEAFYGALLNFDVMSNIGSATFMSYDGYHHHLGANVWGGRTPPPENALGLDHYELVYPDVAQVEALVTQLRNADVPVMQDDTGYIVRDPSQNTLRLTSA